MEAVAVFMTMLFAVFGGVIGGALILFAPVAILYIIAKVMK